MAYGSKHLSDDKLAEMLDDLKSHFGEPVRPVSEYCQAFYDWQKVIAIKVQEIKEELEELGGLTDDEYFERYFAEPYRRLGYGTYEREKWDGERYGKKQLESDLERWQKTQDALSFLILPITKSNFLWRTIYGDGLVRTEKCPKHQGKWSGYASMEDNEFTCEYGCIHGYDQTGWLPESHVYLEPPPSTEAEYEDGKIIRIGHRYLQNRCYSCGGTRELGNHISAEEAEELPFLQHSDPGDETKHV